MKPVNRKVPVVVGQVGATRAEAGTVGYDVAVPPSQRPIKTVHRNAMVLSLFFNLRRVGALRNTQGHVSINTGKHDFGTRLRLSLLIFPVFS